MQNLIPVEKIISKIYLIRREKVMLDQDLAGLYGVETGQLKRAVRRNIDRFPADFMFELTAEEFEAFRSRNEGALWGGSRFAPMAFSEQGVAMLSSVLHSKRAVEVNIAIMRAFVKLRQFLMSHKDLALKVEAMEKKYDQQFQVIFEAIKQLMQPPQPKKLKIGFKPSK